jgi:hypothetical protein
MSQRRHFFEFLQGDAERILDQVGSGFAQKSSLACCGVWSAVAAVC